ncbi:YheC/YheD family protein [Ammoniphilus sp. CFH 90114]|uniref:YheC/YheD family endospore coat-associated protein n=1 Tax=Ammoniphilus sp. CFH 90114 TaxID=2493665 RepID=UPI00100F73E0|nr:YheC/YheD family protein [Ammoniphilus sp. CFH 90114]RXT04808.1 YheC/YheD family protein [Ammoniphilus sp. CFH 90114]
MESKRVRIQFLQTSKYNGIVLSNDLCRSLGIENRNQIYVQLGQRRVLTRLFKARKGTNEIWFSPQLKRELVVPFSGQLHAKVEGDTLRIGPVVGILSTGISIVNNQLVSKRASFFRHLLSAQRGEALYYYLFTPSSVDWEAKTVRGMFLQEGPSGSYWRQAVVPLPDVVYNRIPDRYSEKASTVQTFKAKLEHLTDAKMFNPTFFNKWSIHQQLQDHSFASQHIPETFVGPSVTKVQSMLQNHRMVYLKPVAGSLGLGIMKIVYRPGAGYFLSYHNNSQNVIRRYRTLAALLQAHIPRSRLNTYLVQQGIQLIKYNGRPLDFRVHAHKNRENQWVIAAIAAKIAGQGSVTTHVRTGGTVVSGEDLIKQVFQGQGANVERKLRETTVRMAEAIESRLNQHIGELGFDIGIDERGHIWMFEANSRPGRSIFKHNSFKEADKKSIRLIVDYSRYLANFK